MIYGSWQFKESCGCLGKSNGAGKIHGGSDAAESPKEKKTPKGGKKQKAKPSALTEEESDEDEELPF